MFVLINFNTNLDSKIQTVILLISINPLLRYLTSMIRLMENSEVADV